MRRTTAALALSLLFCVSTAHGREPSERVRVDLLIERYRTDRDALRSFYDVPLSTTRRERLRAFHREWRGRVAGLPFDVLDRESRIDVVLFENELERALASLSFEAARDAETRTLLPFADDLIAMEESRRRMEPVDGESSAKKLDAARKAVAAIRRRVRRAGSGKASGDALEVSRVLAHRAGRQADALARMMKTWFAYTDGYEPTFSWWAKKPFEALHRELTGYARHLREEIAGAKGAAAPLIGDPIGRDALVAALGYEMIAYTPEELLAVAREQFAWCETEGEKASRELGLDGDWKKAVEHVKGLHAAPGEQDDLVAKQGRDAVAFVEERELVTVPPLCKELWRLRMLSADAQKTLPFAAYSGNAMLVAYPTHDMTHEQKVMAMRGNNEHFTRIVTPHELIPGHHLQLFAAERHNTHRRLFRTPFLVEGWALHWEMLLWDQGYARGPEDRIGMLFWRKHRAARIIVTLEFHLGNWSPQKMIDFLVERVGLERDGATSEVRRYIAGNYGPLYQCAYMLGGLQLRALHRRLVVDGAMSNRTFHDLVLEENSIPVEMIRRALTEDPIERDREVTWRFAGDPK